MDDEVSGAIPDIGADEPAITGIPEDSSTVPRTSTPKPEVDPLDQLIEAEASKFLEDEPEDPEEDEDEDEDETEPEAKKPELRVAKPDEKPALGRADKRIQKLVTARKEAEARAQQYEQQFAKAQEATQRQAWELQSKFSEIERQNAVLQRELELTRQAREMQEEQNLDPVDKARRDLQRESLAQAEKRFLPELQKLEERHQQMLANIEQQKQAQVQQQRAQERQGRIAGYKHEAQSAARELMGHFDEKLLSKLTSDVELAVLNIAAARDLPIAQAAQEFHKQSMRYALAQLQHRNKAAGSKLEKAAKIPKGSSSRKAATGSPLPSWEELKAQGFDNYVDYMRAKSA